MTLKEIIDDWVEQYEANKGLLDAHMVTGSQAMQTFVAACRELYAAATHTETSTLLDAFHTASIVRKEGIA